jgi:hypothetical protein
MQTTSLLALRSSLLAFLCIAPPLAAQKTRTVIVVPGQLTQVITDTTGTPYEVPFAVGRVYTAVLAAYKELKIPADIQDSLQGRVESNVFHRRGDLGGKQISTYLGCGDGITGPYADSYRVYMIVTTTIVPKGENRSTIRTVLLGGAVNVSEGARQPMACESTGRWEIRLHKLVVSKAAGL